MLLIKYLLNVLIKSCRYRNLQQLVPEFDKFLHDNPISLAGLSREQGSELLGARLVGRWKSGTQRIVIEEIPFETLLPFMKVLRLLSLLSKMTRLWVQIPRETMISLSARYLPLSLIYVFSY